MVIEYYCNTLWMALQNPGRIFPGKRMAGHMGNKNCTKFAVRVNGNNYILRYNFIKLKTSSSNLPWSDSDWRLLSVTWTAYSSSTRQTLPWRSPILFSWNVIGDYFFLVKRDLGFFIYSWFVIAHIWFLREHERILGIIRDAWTVSIFLRWMHFAKWYGGTPLSWWNRLLHF